jgi:hypothetical protein
MYKSFICFFIIAIGFTSCRPSYMRCPKNRRCEITPFETKTPLIIDTIHSSKNEVVCLNY